MAGLVVVKPGMLTTVQDRGREGLQGMGVPAAGPMDPFSHRAANRIVGNGREAATLEVTLIGPEVAFEEDAVIAVAGAAFALTVDGAAAPMWGPIEVRAGARLAFGARSRGARAYLAVAGGIAVPPVLGSRATSLSARMGPFGGRPLAAGDRLPLAAGRARRVAELQDAASFAASAEIPLRDRPLPQRDGAARLRVMWGPQDHLFAESARAALTAGRYVVTPQSNRMGYRLEGPPLAHRGSADILSDATPNGTLQVPGSGQPILLMADRGTSGGYPKIATVITADLAVAGQLAPGDMVAFDACERRDALAALRAQEALVGGGR